jgi:hypothetical protein
MSDVRADVGEVVEKRSTPDVHIGSVVLEAISDATDTPVADLGLELNDYVDPDALDDLFGPRLDGESRPGGRVVFEVADCEVTVHDGRRVVVRRE